MAIKIVKVRDQELYVATLSPPHFKSEWTSKEPLPLRELIHELQNKGCHQQDIGDALYEADPSWVSKLG
jgi:hypothetical protein